MRFNKIRLENVMKKTNTTYSELNSHFNFDIESMVKKENVIGSVIKHICDYMGCNFDYVIDKTDTLKIKDKVYTCEKVRKHKLNYIDNVLIPEIIKIMVEDNNCTFKLLCSFMDKKSIFDSIPSIRRLKCINPDNLNNLCWVLHCSISDITTITDNNEIITKRILNSRQKYSIKFDMIENKLEYLSKIAKIPMHVLNDLRDNNYVSIEFIQIVANSLRMTVDEISNYTTKDKEEKCMSDYHENTDIQLSNENESVDEAKIEVQTTTYTSDINNDEVSQLSDDNDNYNNRKPYYNNYRNTRRYGNNNRRRSNKWKDIDSIPLNAIISRLNICSNDELDDIAKYIESVKNIREIKTIYNPT